jgi:hypothetical protein
LKHRRRVDPGAASKVDGGARRREPSQDVEEKIARLTVVVLLVVLAPRVGDDR